MSAPTADRERRAARRRRARALHPDLGGDPAAFVAAFAAPPDRGAGPIQVVRTGRLRRSRHRLRAVLARMRDRPRPHRYARL